jgi:hypothetical protein
METFHGMVKVDLVDVNVRIKMACDSILSSFFLDCHTLKCPVNPILATWRKRLVLHLYGNQGAPPYS